MPEKYKVVTPWFDPEGQDWENIYFDPSLTQPAVVTAALPVKFNGSQEAARRYAEGYQWGQKNVVDPRERTAPYVAAGLAGAMAAPVLLDAGAMAAANPYVRMAVDMAGNIDGMRNALSDNGIRKTIRKAREGDVWGTAKSAFGDLLDISGSADFLRMASKFGRANRALHAFNEIEPFGYDQHGKRFKKWVNSIMQDNPVDVTKAPSWRAGAEKKFSPFFPDEKELGIVMDAREDAWRIYNGIPQRNGTYIRNADGSYSYDIANMVKKHPNFRIPTDGGVDNIAHTHGGLWEDTFTKTGENEGVRHIMDWWDLHPFAKAGIQDNRLSNILNSKIKQKVGDIAIREKAQDFRRMMYEKGHWGLFDNKNTFLGKMTKWMDNPLNKFRSNYNHAIQDGFKTVSAGRIDRAIDKATSALDPFSDRFAKLEAGTIIGGKPFKMQTDIPMYGIQERLPWLGGGMDGIPKVAARDFGGLIDRLKAHYGDNDKIREAIAFARGGNKNKVYDPDEVLWSPSIPVETPDTVGQYNWDDMKLRQYWAESRFHDDRISPAGAKGRYQIMPITQQDYIMRGGKTGNLMDPEYNEAIRDDLVTLLRTDQYFDEANTDPLSYAAMIAGAYNMGRTGFKKRLKALEKKGYDIRNSADWVDAFPVKETRDYMKFVGLGADVGKDLTKEAYDAAVLEHGFRSGGKIHINPENRGKFTALKKRTGHSASWFKVHGTPAQKKMAVFALNARKWKHADGGFLLPHYYTGGGTVAETWKQRTGKDWAEVGNYYKEYDKTAKGNLRLLDQLNSGQYDWIKTGQPEPTLLSAPKEKEQAPVNRPIYVANPQGLSREETKDIQRMLVDHGYDIGPKGIDGWFGPRTTKAYQEYLINSGYDVGPKGADGVFGERTKAASNEIGKLRHVPGDNMLLKAPEKTVVSATVPAPDPVSKPIGFALEKAIYEEPHSVSAGFTSEQVNKPDTLSNFGQLYNEKYDDLTIGNGINASNVHVPEDSGVDYSRIYYGGGLNYGGVQSAAEDARRITDNGKLTACSAFVQTAIADKFGWDYVKGNGMRGDAWKIGDSMERAGGKRYFDLFHSSTNDMPWVNYICDAFGVKSLSELKSKYGNKDSQSAVGRKLYDYVKKDYAKHADEYAENIMNSVHEGDVVELMYRGSSHSVDSLSSTSGKNPNTHVGYISKIGDKLYVMDNVSGNVHIRPLEDVAAGKAKEVLIAGLLRPAAAKGDDQDVSPSGRTARRLDDFGITRTGEKAKTYRFDNDTAYRMMGALYNNKENLSNYLGLTPEEYNMLAGVVHMIGFKETSNGEFADNRDVLAKKGAQLRRQYGEDVEEFLPKGKTAALNGIQTAGELGANLLGYRAADFNSHLYPSLGTVQIKLGGMESPLNQAQLDTLGESGMAAIRDVQPESSAIAAMMAVANNYKYLKQIFEMYDVPVELRDRQHIMELMGKMYNSRASLVAHSFANADKEAASSDEDRLSIFQRKYDTMYNDKNNSYMRGIHALSKYHNYDLFSAEEIDMYNEERERKRQESVDNIMNMVVENRDLAPAIMTLIHNMSKRDAQHYGAAAARNKDTVAAYRSGNLTVKPDTRKDKKAAKAYMKAFKENLSGD